MSRRDQQFRSLAVLESRFSSLVHDATVAAADDASSQFFLSEKYNPWPELRGRTDAVTDQLISDAEEILKLRRVLRADPNCLASRFDDYCRRFVDLSDHHRPGVRKHARAMLGEIHDGSDAA